MLSKLVTVSFVALISLSGPYQQADEIAALRREIATLKAQQAAMQRDLDVIKQLLQTLARGGRPQDDTLTNASLAIDGEPSKGSSSARLTMVEVSDYHCPFCRRHMQQTAPQIDADYIKTGKLRYVFVDYPIEQLHPDAFKAHEAANCAADQGKYWEMHAKLFESPTRDLNQLATQAESVGLNVPTFRNCMETGKYQKAVRDSVARMQQLGVDSTPTFLIGATPPAGQPMKVVKVIKGAVPYSAFKTTLDAVIQQQ